MIEISSAFILDRPDRVFISPLVFESIPDRAGRKSPPVAAAEPDVVYYGAVSDVGALVAGATVCLRERDDLKLGICSWGECRAERPLEASW